MTSNSCPELSTACLKPVAPAWKFHSAIRTDWLHVVVSEAVQSCSDRILACFVVCFGMVPGRERIRFLLYDEP